MDAEIPVTEARAQLSDLINRVGFGKERIILTRHGKPLVALVPAELLDDLGHGTGAGSTVLDLSAQTTRHAPADLRIAARDPYPPTVG